MVSNGDSFHVNGHVPNEASEKSQIQDPTLHKTSPAFPLSNNSLEHLMSYKANEEQGLSNSVVSRVALPAGSHFCYVTTHVPAPKTTWSSIQSAADSHWEVESALVYLNHSCQPTMELTVFPPDEAGNYPSSVSAQGDSPAVKGGKYGVAGEFRVARDRDLSVGDDLTFFYPSTEYCSPRPFQCLCGSPSGVCIGVQRGAKFLTEEQAGRHYLNAHITALRSKESKS